MNNPARISRKALLGAVSLSLGLAMTTSLAQAQSEDELVQEYRATLSKLEKTKEYNRIKQASLQDQRKRITALEEEVYVVADLKQGLADMTEEMIVELEKFIADDLPFLTDERATRIEQLRAEPDEPLEDQKDIDAFTVEKFAKALEAFQVENNYGRNLEAEKGSIPDESGEPINVEFLMVGRVALFYHEVEGRRHGMWDRQTRTWLTGSSLPAGAEDQIQAALQIANGDAPPDLLLLPLPSPEGPQES